MKISKKGLKVGGITIPIWALLIIGLLFTAGVSVTVFSNLFGGSKDIGSFQATPLTRRIRTEVEDVTLHFQVNLSWNEGRFSEILQNTGRFKANWIENFTERFNHGENFAIEFEEKTSSSILKCKIHDVITKNGEEYYGTFSWLLDPFALDFIDDAFNESKTGLSWEGTINEVETFISLKFPKRDTPYTAWHHPNGHCHAHIWWKAKK